MLMGDMMSEMNPPPWPKHPGIRITTGTTPNAVLTVNNSTGITWITPGVVPVNSTTGLNPPPYPSNITYGSFNGYSGTFQPRLLAAPEPTYKAIVCDITYSMVNPPNRFRRWLSSILFGVKWEKIE